MQPRRGGCYTWPGPVTAFVPLGPSLPSTLRDIPLRPGEAPSAPTGSTGEGQKEPPQHRTKQAHPENRTAIGLTANVKTNVCTPSLNGVTVCWNKGFTRQPRIINMGWESVDTEGRLHALLYTILCKGPMAFGLRES